MKRRTDPEIPASPRESPSGRRTSPSRAAVAPPCDKDNSQQREHDQAPGRAAEHGVGNLPAREQRQQHRSQDRWKDRNHRQAPACFPVHLQPPQVPEPSISRPSPSVMKKRSAFQRDMSRRASRSSRTREPRSESPRLRAHPSRPSGPGNGRTETRPNPSLRRRQPPVRSRISSSAESLPPAPTRRTKSPLTPLSRRRTSSTGPKCA